MITYTIDIIDKKVLGILKELELLKMIHVKKEHKSNWVLNYKGVLEKQSLEVIDNQLNELRNEWE